MCLQKGASRRFCLVMCASNQQAYSIESSLSDQVFYVSSVMYEYKQLKDNITSLGGKIETFFSKDITTLLVEDCYVEVGLATHEVSDTSSPKPNDVLMDKAARCANKIHENTSQKISATPTRGYSLLVRAKGVEAQSSKDNYTLRLIEKAKRWGIQIVGIKQFTTWLESKLSCLNHKKKRKPDVKQNSQSYKIPGLFIKVEDLSQNYKTLYKVFTEEPKSFIPLKNANDNLEGLTAKSNVHYTDLKRQQEQKKIDKNFVKLTENVSKNAISPKTISKETKCKDAKVAKIKAKPKQKKKQFCECCNVTFADLQQHILGAKHQSYMADEKNYECVKNAIKKFPSIDNLVKKRSCQNLKTSKKEPLPLCNKDNTLCNKFNERLPNSLVVDNFKNDILASEGKSVMDNFVLESDHKLFEDKILNCNSPVKEITEMPCLRANSLSVNIPDVTADSKLTKTPNFKLETGHYAIPDGISVPEALFDESLSPSMADFGLKSFENYILDVFSNSLDNNGISLNQEPLDINISEKKCTNNETYAAIEKQLSLHDILNSESAQSSHLTCVETQCLVKEPSKDASLSNSAKFLLASNCDVYPENFLCCKQEMKNFRFNESNFQIKEQCSNLEVDNDSARENTNKLNKMKVCSTLEEETEKICFDTLDSPASSMTDIYLEKSVIEVNHCCSNFLPSKTERMFSSGDSDDDHDGRHLINTALNIIDSESETEKKHIKDNVNNDCNDKLPDDVALSVRISDNETATKHENTENSCLLDKKLCTDFQETIPSNINLRKSSPLALPESKKKEHMTHIPRKRRIPLWSVHQIPGEGIRLLFTRVQQEKIEYSESEIVGFSDKTNLGTQSSDLPKICSSYLSTSTQQSNTESGVDFYTDNANEFLH